ncbi:MAG: acyltransferase [Candidatus Thiodiazotropha sp. (ex Dulcina madagascariensis)]|nr:acyltransferase [Candidatus Thiodiazotropha sp. (ex Dulcina madagascariensis)]MCU7925989.1 acyltransferase [Candidatus Thiodiazotropha sp. (ex Dulcina madagascariensis)]
MSYTTNESSLSFRPDLQGLRAIAILLVVLAHAGLTYVAGGFIGVDVFFVLSGYLITGLLQRELERNGRIAFMSFYARRLKRLLPALITMLIVAFLAGQWILSAVEARAQLESAPFAATWTSNLYYTFTIFDYFDELSSRDLFLHTWSLGLEEQFYLVWPVILLLMFRFSEKWRVGGMFGMKLLFAGLMVIFFLSLALSLYWTANLPQSAFYLMPSRIWQFSLGAIVYLVFLGKPSSATILGFDISKAHAWIALGAGLILIFGSAVVLHPGMAYPGFYALAPSFGAAMAIAAGHGLSAGNGGPLAHPVMVWIGDRSYSIYLWHWPVFVLGFSLGYKGQGLPAIAMVLLSLLAAMLSYRFIERPFWKGRLSHAIPLRILLLSLLVMSVVVYFMMNSLRQLPNIDATTDISNQWRMDVPVIYSMPCDAWYHHSRVEPCVFGTQESKKVVVFLGDSIGAQWFSIIPMLFPEPDWRTVVLTKSSCSMVDEEWFYQKIGRIYQVCTEWRNAVLDEMDKLKPDIIIIGSASTYGFSETEWIEGSARVLKRLEKAAGTIFVIPGTPSLGFDGPGCISRHLSSGGSIDSRACLAKDRLKQVEPVTHYLEQAADRFSNVHVLSLNDLVCPDTYCNAVNKDGVVVFRDNQHLTDAFVRAQVPAIQARIRHHIED